RGLGRWPAAPPPGGGRVGVGGREASSPPPQPSPARGEGARKEPLRLAIRPRRERASIEGLVMLRFSVGANEPEASIPRRAQVLRVGRGRGDRRCSRYTRCGLVAWRNLSFLKPSFAASVYTEGRRRCVAAFVGERQGTFPSLIISPARAHLPGMCSCAFCVEGRPQGPRRAPPVAPDGETLEGPPRVFPREE